MENHLESLLRKISETLERMAPIKDAPAPLNSADAFVWHSESGDMELVPLVNRVEIDLLRGIENQKQALLTNTRRFAKGYPANNALLWGARGTGKSSLVKAVHATINAEEGNALTLVEIHREEVASLPRLLKLLRQSKRRFVLFCDDLSFDGHDAAYKSLKAVLEGGIEGRPENVVFYATSNRRHLMPKEMIENERAIEIHGGESVDEKVSLSDRFGLWIGFHNCDQPTYFEIVEAYADFNGLDVSKEALRTQALEWSMTRGARSGRVAWQFIQDLAGRLGKPLR